MLLRSSSTPFLHSFLSSSRSSLQLCRAISDSHLPSLHPSTPNDSSGSNTGLRTELSFSIYNTVSNKGAPLAPQHPHQGDHEEEQEQDQRTVQPELPLFLARGLGIDRIASGLFTAGAAAKPKQAAAAAKMEDRVQDEKVAAVDAQYKNMVDEQPGNALFLHNYAQFLHEVKGDPRRAEEYYSRAMLADPNDGEIMSQYAKLIWEVHHDEERSLSYFQKSVQAAPDNRQESIFVPTVLQMFSLSLLRPNGVDLHRALALARSDVLAAYASFLREQDDADCGEGEQGTGGGATPPGRAAGTRQVRELATVAV